MLLSAGLFLSLLFFSAAVLGIRWHFSWVFKKFAVGVGSGSISVTHFGPFEFLEAPGLNVAVIPARLWIDYGFTPRHIPSTREMRIETYSIPIWIPFVLVALPTALLWRLDRGRRARGACCCGTT